MPKSFLYAVRDYRYGYYSGGDEQGVNVMTTRSGLSIKKMGVTSKPSTSAPPQAPARDDQRTNNVKTRQRKRQKSNSQLSFVTRFYMRHGVIRGRIPGFAIGDHFTKMLTSSRDDTADDGSDDDEDNSGLDGFILSASENVNNNQGRTTQEILDQKNAWQAKVDAGNIKPDLTNPLVKYFADNRLPDVVASRPSEYELNTETNILYATRPPVNGVYGETTDNRIFIKNNINLNFGANGGKSDTESDDALSSVSSDIFSGFDTAQLVQLPTAPDDPEASSSSSAETKLLKLRDATLKVQFVNTTDGQKMIKCVECNRIFEELSGYLVHLKSHTKSSTTCFICGKEFSRSWLLKGHLRVHTGERPYTCTHPGCHKSFADKSNLRSHTMIHSTNKKDHKCDKCGRSFAQKRYLHKHMQEVCRVLLD